MGLFLEDYCRMVKNQPPNPYRFVGYALLAFVLIVNVCGLYFIVTMLIGLME